MAVYTSIFWGGGGMGPYYKLYSPFTGLPLQNRYGHNKVASPSCTQVKLWTQMKALSKLIPSWHICVSHWLQSLQNWIVYCFLSPIYTVNSESFPGVLIIHTHYLLCPQNYCVMLIHVKTKKGQTSSKNREVGEGGWMCRQGNIIQPSKPYPSMKFYFLILQNKFPNSQYLSLKKVKP